MQLIFSVIPAITSLSDKFSVSMLLLLVCFNMNSTYLTAGDEGSKIVQSDECHKAANVIDKPGGRI